MERIWYVLIGIGACIIGLFLFVLGYRAVRYHQFRGKWVKEFWISVAIVMAFLSTTFYGSRLIGDPPTGEAGPPERREQETNKERDSFSKLQKIWQESIKKATWDNDKQIQEETNKLIAKIQKERQISDKLKLVITLLFSQRISHISSSSPLVKCYKMSEDGVKQRDTMTGLEQQYILLNKMVKEGKINQETVNKTKEAVKNHYKELKNWVSDKPILDGLSDEESNQLVDFVIELSGIRAEELMNENTEKQINQRVVEIKKTAEWRRLRKLFKNLAGYLTKREGRKGEEEIPAEIKQQQSDIAKEIESLKSSETKDNLFSVKEALMQISAISAGVISHKDRMLATCYRWAPREGVRRNEDYQTQRQLLEQQLKEGKISNQVYGKVVNTIDGAESISRYNARTGQGYLFEELNHANTVLVFRLLRDVYAPKEPIRWEEVEPKLKEKINQLINDLNSEDWKTRDSAQEALIQIDEPAIPALKETLEKSKEPEVLMRAKKILEELE